jgi:hypothetical protein
MASKLNLKEHRCPSCHAPLPVGPQDASVTCRYCGNTITIERAKPPKIPSPTPPLQPVLYVPPRSTSVAPVLGAIAFLVVAVGGISALRLGASHLVTFPATCPVNGTLTISGKTFKGTGTVIEAGANCTVTIERSTLDSDGPIVKGGGNLTLKIVGSTLTSKTEALELDANAKVRIEGDSRIQGHDAALKADANLRLSVERSVLSSDRATIDVAPNAEMTFASSEITSNDEAIVTKSNAKIVAKGLVIKAKETGIRFDSSNGELDARNTTITAGGSSIRAEFGADLKLSDACSLTSERNDAILASGSNTKLRMSDSKVQGKLTGARLGVNAKVQLQRNASIVGEQAALSADSNLELTVDGATIKSSGVAVQGSSNARIRVLAGSTVQGTPAFRFPSMPAYFDAADGTVTGERQFSSTSSGDSPRGQDAILIRRVLDPSASQVATCGSGGTMLVRFTIPPAGQPVTVTKLMSSVSKTTEDCALAKLRAIRFPPRSDTTSVQMTYRF